MSTHHDRQQDSVSVPCVVVPATRPLIIKFTPLPPHIPLFVSDTISDHLGFAPCEVVGNPSFLIDTLHPADVDQFISSLFHLFIRGSHMYDYRLLRKDRTISRMIVEMRLDRDASGAPLNITGTYARPSLFVSDLAAAHTVPGLRSDRSAAQLELEIDPAGCIRSISPAVQRILGYRPRDLVGQSVLRIVPADYHILLRRILARLLDGCMESLFFWIAVKHRNGETRFFVNECRTFNHPEGERYVRAVCHEITDRLVAIQAVFASLREADGNPSNTSPVPGDILTPREREVLYLVVGGYSSSQIGSKLYISPRTVDVHRSNLMRKLRVTSVSQLMRYTWCGSASPSSQ